MKNHSEDLRNHLFATLEALQDPEKPMEIDRAKAVAEVAREAINLAKTEIDFIRITGLLPEGSVFGNSDKLLPAPSSVPQKPRLIGRGQGNY